MNQYPGERLFSFLCDYGFILLATFLVAFVAFWRVSVSPASPPESIPVTPEPATTSLPPSATATVSVGETPSVFLPTEAPTVMVPHQPEFILVFIPIAWHSDQSLYEQTAQLQADDFVRESHIDQYFKVQVEILTTGPENVSLSDDSLDSTVLEYGLMHMPGDRYIGITDGDLILDGNSDIAGWTTGFGAQSAVLEDSDPYATAHELGHTFGLCDEYSYVEWNRQNGELTNGCPNPYPSTCPKSEEDGVTCEGTPTQDGRNSIMGPAGMKGEYGFNSACLNYLLQVFKDMVTRGGL